MWADRENEPQDNGHGQIEVERCEHAPGASGESVNHAATQPPISGTVMNTFPPESVALSTPNNSKTGIFG